MIGVRDATWSLDGFAGTTLLIVRVRPSDDRLLVPLSTEGALSWLSRWLLDQRSCAVLVEVYESLFGHLSLSSWGEWDLHRVLREALTRAIEAGDVLILEPLSDGFAVDPEQPHSEPSPSSDHRPPSQRRPGTFIEIELLDDRQSRFPSRLKITLPDSTVREPRFDGFVRIDGIKAGLCEIEFPEIDGREWGLNPGGAGAGPPGGSAHRASEGECISSLAESHGFKNWRTIYDDPKNEELRSARPNPNLLTPGDVVFIPERAPRVEESMTGRRVTYRVLALPTRLRIQFGGKSTNDYELRIAGQVLVGRVAEGSIIDEIIPATATRAELIMRPVAAPDREDRWTVFLGALDPVSTLRGVQARLDNMAFQCPVDDQIGPETTAAVASFQHWSGHEPADGEIDDGTRSDLARLHDGNG